MVLLSAGQRDADQTANKWEIDEGWNEGQLIAWTLKKGREGGQFEQLDGFDPHACCHVMFGDARYRVGAAGFARRIEAWIGGLGGVQFDFEFG
jgi:hypothetical protein